MVEVERALRDALTAKPSAWPRLRSRRSALAACACVAVVGVAAWAADVLPMPRTDSTATSAPPRTPLGPRPSKLVAPFSEAAAQLAQAGWAKHLATPVRIDAAAGIPMVLVPPGEFTMGSAGEPLTAPPDAADWRYRESEVDRQLQLPPHRVTLTQPVYFSATEVTNGQFHRFVDATGYITDAERTRGWGKEDKGWVRRAGYSWRNMGQRVCEDEYPVINVSWNDAVALCEWLTSIDRRGVYRLPTEAQWEFACRAGATTIYSFGNDPRQLAEHAWFGANSEGKFRPVGLKQPNAFGLYDMHGNRQEWCRDNFEADYYKSSPPVDPLCDDGGDLRVLRGGVHTDVAWFCTAAQRWAQDASDPGASGIRVICEPLTLP
jgi:formylglycine-generating enzyme required for sulfatase activity